MCVCVDTCVVSAYKISSVIYSGLIILNSNNIISLARHSRGCAGIVRQRVQACSASLAVRGVHCHGRRWLLRGEPGRRVPAQSSTRPREEDRL